MTPLPRACTRAYSRAGAGQILILAFLLTAPPATAEIPVTKTDAPAAEKPEPLWRADAGLAKAEAQYAEGKYMQAIETLGGVLQRRPGDADALAYLGRAWLEMGDDKKAEAHIDRALAADPKHLGANLCRAELYLKAGDVPRAIEQMQAMRLVCAGLPCAELDALQAKINAHKKAE